MILQTLPFLGDAPPVLVDWLPWHHTFGGNHNLNQAIAFVARYEAALLSEPDTSRRRVKAWQAFGQVLFAGSEFVYVN